MSNKYRYFRTLEKGFTEFCQLRLLHLENVGSFKNKHKQKSFSRPFWSFSVKSRCAGRRGLCWGTQGCFPQAVLGEAASLGRRDSTGKSCSLRLGDRIEISRISSKRVFDGLKSQWWQANPWSLCYLGFC